MTKESFFSVATDLLEIDEDALDSANGASFGSVSATYRTVDGETGTVSEPSEVVFRAKGRC